MDNFQITEKGGIITVFQTVYPEVCITFDCSRTIPVVVKIDIRQKDCDPGGIFSAIEEINKRLELYLESRSRTNAKPID